jgi:hypothetical protein
LYDVPRISGLSTIGELVMFKFNRGFNWRNSEVHLLLLSKFLNSQEIDYFTKLGNWEQALNEVPQKAIERFVDEGMLEIADLETIVSYKYKVSELKSLLKQRGLAASGTKDELVKRILQADEAGMSKLTVGIKLLTCTQTGREIAQQYLDSEKEKHLKVEKQVIGYIVKRMFKEASLAVAEYEAGQVFVRGMGVNWKHYNPNRDIQILQNIYKNKPQILNKLDDSKLDSLRLGAAMMLLWGTNKATKWIPADFETGLSMDTDVAARMFLFNAQSIVTLKEFKEMGIEYVEVLGVLDSCESCKEIIGKIYRISEVPTLPNPNCTHEMGCRCVYLASVNQKK